MSSSFVFASKSIGKLLSRQNNLGFLKRSTKSEVEKLFQEVRCLSSIAGIETTPCIDKLIYADKKYEFLFGDLSSSNVQRRDFLSCGGGGEGGNFLSKTYEEKRVLGYSPEQLFAVVSAVDLYQEFVPWCQRSEIIRRNDDGSFDAKLEIGFKFLVESYVSHVELIESKSVKSTVSESTLFDHLTNIWEFNPGPVPGSCNVHFFVDFKFQSPLYRQAASVFFKEVVSRLVGSFTDRCQVIYGPATPVVENSYGEDNL